MDVHNYHPPPLVSPPGRGLGGGFLNNYAVEPQPYYAEYPAPFQQRRYLVQGAIPKGSR